MNFFQKNRLSPLLVVMFFITVCVFASCQKSDTPTVMNHDASVSGVEVSKNVTGGVQNRNGTWTENPFQTGSMVSTGSALKFRKPNTEWKSRTIQLKDGRWVSYEFGKGNPASVALDQEALNKLAQECNNPISIDQLYKNGDCLGSPSGIARPLYVFPEVEQNLLLALRDDNWSKLLNECQPAFYEAEKNWSLSRGYYDAVFVSGNLDLENFLSVNDSSGRKQLSFTKVAQLIDDIQQAYPDGGPRNIAGNFHNASGECVQKYASGIIQNLQDALSQYRIPEGYLSSDKQ